MDRWQKGEHIKIEVTFYNKTTNLPSDCDSTPTITITNAEGTAVASSQNMTSGSNTGEYYYVHQIGSTSEEGVFNYVATGTIDSYDSIVRGAFEVV